MNSKTTKNACYALISFFSVFITALVGSFITSNNIPTWYKTLNLPAITPPNYVFPIAWNIIFLLIIISFYLVLKEDSKLKSNLTKNVSKLKKEAVVIFYLQLIFNLLWSLLFFGMHLILFALIEIVILELLIISLILKFRKINLTAAYLLIPYAAWVLFATILNLYIFLLN